MPRVSIFTAEYRPRDLEFGGLRRLLIKMDPSQGLLDLIQNLKEGKIQQCILLSTLVNNRKGLSRALGFLAKRPRPLKV